MQLIFDNIPGLWFICAPRIFSKWNMGAARKAISISICWNVKLKESSADTVALIYLVAMFFNLNKLCFYGVHFVPERKMVSCLSSR